ncbi:MAG: hypothetical protein AB2552_20565 [Candidatus Thiodiazotropha endolucinida]
MTGNGAACRRPLNDIPNTMNDSWSHEYYKFDDGSTTGYSPGGILPEPSIHPQEQCLSKYNDKKVRDKLKKMEQSKDWEASDYWWPGHDCHDFMDELLNR